MQTYIVIMAGGIGSRFWPMSTPSYPKQFIDVMGMGKTLIQLTVERFKKVCPQENFWVVTSEKYVEIVKKQLPHIPTDQILAEPTARNTAPCIAYACWKIKKKFPEANVVVTPSDALVINTEEFACCIKTALKKVENSSAIITLGICPNRPETGYGYIAANNKKDDNGIYEVEAFKEKPDFNTAVKYLNEGNYFWNAGIFIWNIDTIISALKKYAPQIANVMNELEPALCTEYESTELKRLFPTCDKISIDYAVMEKAKDIHVLPAEFGWSDLGSWGSLHSLLPNDNQKNSAVGNNIKMFDCQNCIVHTSEEKQVVVEGLDGYIVAEKDGRLLICRLKNEQMIKEFSK